MIERNKKVKEMRKKCSKNSFQESIDPHDERDLE